MSIRRALVGVLVATMFTAAACSDDPDPVTPDTTVLPTTTTVEPRVDDGVLQIGVLLPSTGEGAPIGQSALAAIRLAVDQVNAFGGVNGETVQLFVRDEGDEPATAAVGLNQLIENQVDVIIGPASSRITLSVAQTIVDAGVVACSPAASALALNEFPDNDMLLRTIAPDSLQIDAMARVVEQTGDTTAAIAYIDDGYGRPFEQQLRLALALRGITVTDSVGFAVDDDEFTTEATRLANAGAGAIALIADPDAGSQMLAALAAATEAAPRDIIVNDALRQPWSLSLLASVSPTARARIVGVSANVLTEDPTLRDELAERSPGTTGLFATQAYDCANLLMLAAQQSGSTSPSAIAAAMGPVSSGGSVCATFDACAVLLADGLNIDYSGPSGTLSLGPTGDPMSAVFEKFGFDDTGRDVRLSLVLATTIGDPIGS